MKSLGRGSLALLIILVSVLSFTGCTTVEPGYAGITVHLTGGERGVDDYPIETGRVFYNPLTSDVIKYPTFVQRSVWTRSKDEGSDTNEEILFNDRDGMAITADIAYAYQLKREKVPHFYVKFKADDIQDFTDGYVRDLVRMKFNEICGSYNVEAILEQKQKIVTEVKDAVNAEMASFGIEFELLGFIGAIRPPAAIIANINAKIQATQLAMTAENELRTVEAQAAKAVTEATGAANARIEKARGDAQSVLIAKRAEAEGNRLVAASITPNLLKWRNLANVEYQVAAWAGGAKVPQTFIAGGGPDGGHSFLYNLGGSNGLSK